MELLDIMIVDDDKIIIRDLMNIIDWNEHGFRIVTIAYNGQLGVAKCEEKKPHIIFTDIKMPIMDGLDMMREIKKKNPNIKFIILSAYGEFEYAQQAITLGAHAYVLKSKLSSTSLLDILIPLRNNIAKQNEKAIFTIYNIVNLCIEGTYSNIDLILNELNLAFDYYIVDSDSFALSVFTDRLGELISKAYKQNGKSEFFNIPQIHDKKDLGGWLHNQLHLIDRWHQEVKDDKISPIISKAVFYIESNFTRKDLNVKDIAESLSISISWLSVCFKKEIGCTLNDYIRKIRIDHAKKYLQQGNHKVYEVADLVGFSSSQYFSKTFFQETKQLPQNYRRDLDM